MNVLLLFANIALFLSVIKDFLDTNWKWENKMMINIILFTISLLPTSFNFFVFMNSDLPLLKVFIYNVFKAFTMDYFETYLENRCFEDNINIFGIKFGKWIFCNKATGSHCEFNSGDVYVCDPTMSFRGRFHKLWGSTELTMNFHAMADLLDIKIDHVYPKFTGEIKVTSLKFGRKIANLLHKFGNRVDWVVYEIFPGEFIYYNENLNLICESLGSIKISENGIKLNSALISWKDIDSSLDEFIKKINVDCLNFSKFCYNIGFLSIHIFRQGDSIKILKTPLNDRSKTVFLHENLSVIQAITLDFILKNWAENPSLGIILDEDSRIVSRVEFNKRKEAFILHSLSPEQIVERVINDDLFYISNFPSSKYYVEDENLSEGFSNVFNKYVVKVFGESNSKIFNGLIGEHFKNADDLDLMNIKSNLMETTQIPNLFKKLKGKISNRKFKILLVDVNYFFGLIGYKRLNGVDKKVVVSRFASQLCRKHVKILESSPLNFEGSRSSNLKLIDELKSTEKELDLTVKAKPLRQLKSRINKIQGEIKSKSLDETLKLKGELTKTFKEVLETKDNTNLGKRENLASEILKAIYNGNKPKVNKEEHQTGSEVKKEKSKKEEVFKYHHPDQKVVKKKSQRVEERDVLKKTPKNLFKNNKNKKVINFICDKMPCIYTPNRFKILKNLPEEYISELKEVSCNYREKVSELSSKAAEDPAKKNLEALKLKREAELKLLEAQLEKDRLKNIIKAKYPRVDLSKVNKYNVGGYNTLVLSVIDGTSAEDALTKNITMIPEVYYAINRINSSLNEGEKVSKRMLIDLKVAVDSYQKKKNKIWKKLQSLDMLEKRLIEEDLLNDS